MKNINTVSEMINQVKEIEKNMSTNQEYTNSMTMLMNSNDLSKSKDKDLTDKVEKLNNHIEDINQLTSDLLEDLASRHN
ncbi:MAG TPA: hypothetical protein VK087_03740 [Tissierellaceae bacterium]|nr:hypothetical protein [Tissierellaceae bacterium]